MKFFPRLSVLFRLSDAFAWLVFIVAAYTALAIPFVEFVPHAGATSPARLPFYLSILCVVVAFGAFHLTRRHLFGLPPIFLLPVALNFFTNWSATALYILFALLVFGTPFLLVFIEARRKAHHVAS